MPDITTEDATLHVEVEGEGLPVTVFAHGLTNSRNELAAFTPFLAGTKVRFDFRGHGLSSAPETGYRFADFARDLDAVAAEYGATHAVGTSLGAGAITNLISREPDRFERIVFLLPAALDVPLADHHDFDRTAERLETLTKEQAIEAILSSPDRTEIYERAPWLRDFDMLLWQDMNPLGVARAIREVVRDVAVEDRRAAPPGHRADDDHQPGGRSGAPRRARPGAGHAHAERRGDRHVRRGRADGRDPDVGGSREGLPRRDPRVTDGAATRRATDPRGELSGSVASATMAVLFAFVVIFGKQVAAGNLPFVMLAMRFGGQSILLLIALRLFGRPFLPVKGERLPLVIAGTIGYGSESAFYFSALNHGSAAAITLLFYLYPVWVMLATIALDRKAPPRLLFLALFLALVGSALVVLGGGDAQIEPIGIVLALCTSFAYTGYLIGTDRNVKRTDPLTAAAWLGVGASLANLVYAFAFSAVDLPAAGSWWRIVGMAVFSAGAFAAMLAGLQLVGAVRNAIIGVMEPLTVAVLAYFFLDEPVTMPIVVGGVLILCGAVLAMRIRTTKTVEPPV